MFTVREIAFIEFLSYSVTLFYLGSYPRSDMAEQLYAQMLGWA